LTAVAARVKVRSMASADPLRLALEPVGVAVREAACAASAPVRLGLLMNPRAKRLQRAGTRSALGQMCGGREAWVETRDLASLRRAMAYLLCVRGANVVAVCGGDGTVHHAVNTLLELTHEAEVATGTRPPLPRLLLLNGGTLNIVGRTMQIHGSPERTLRKFQHYFAGVPLSRLPARRLPLMEVAWTLPGAPTGLRRYGFVFGSEAPFHALELYGRFGAGYAGLSRFLVEFARGALFGSQLWRDESWKLGPFTTPLRVDDRTYERYTGVVACTVDLTLAIGAARSIRRELHAPGFAVRVVWETEPLALVRLVPALMSERGARGIDDFKVAQRLELFGPYTLDGECFSQPAVAAERLPLTVVESSERLHAVPGVMGSDEW
jgi:hypothetical protein